MKKYGYMLLILPVFLFYQNCGQSGDITLQSQLDKAVKSVPADTNSDDNQVNEPQPPAATDAQTDTQQPSSPSSPTTTQMPPSVPTNPKSDISDIIIPPGIEAKALPEIVKEQDSAVIEVKYQNLSKISYTCQDKSKTQTYLNSSKILSDLSSSGIFSVIISNITSDVYCDFIGENSQIATLVPIKASVSIQLDCMNKLKNDLGRCEDFKCQKVMELGLQDLSNIPARTSAGICYAVKLMSKIANSSSLLNRAVDTEVISRSHDNGASNPLITRNPYILNTFKGEVTILGERVIKLAGAADASKNILVDNFVLTGVYPVSNNESAAQLVKHYKVRGTSDSAIKDASGNFGVLFRNILLPVISFGSAGTSSVEPIDISAEIIPNIPHTIDIRALDCGGSRELSDIYLLFQ